MQLSHLSVLKRAANHRLDEQRRAVREQAEAVAALETALGALDAEVAREASDADLFAPTLLLLPEWLDVQRRRREALVAELTAARDSLERCVDMAREVYLELRSVDHLIDKRLACLREEERHREEAFLDFVGERLHRDRRSGGA